MSILHRSHPKDAGPVTGEVGTDVRPFQVEIPERGARRAAPPDRGDALAF